MQNTSQLYKDIVAGDHWFETMIAIEDTQGNLNGLSESSIFSVTISRNGMSENKPSVGGALSAVLNCKIVKPTFSIPRLARVLVRKRAKNSVGYSPQRSEWLNSGTFWIDTRCYNKTLSDTETMSITAYDSMAKADADYPNTSHSWPYLDKSVVAEIASAIGVTVDSRTNNFLTAGYMIDLPVGYTMRETLAHIAGAYGGNFVMTADNALLFVPLYGLEPDITGDYLADENGNALVFGNEGWCILV